MAFVTVFILGRQVIGASISAQRDTISAVVASQTFKIDQLDLIQREHHPIKVIIRW